MGTTIALGFLASCLMVQLNHQLDLGMASKLEELFCQIAVFNGDRRASCVNTSQREKEPGTVHVSRTKVLFVGRRAFCFLLAQYSSDSAIHLKPLLLRH